MEDEPVVQNLHAFWNHHIIVVVPVRHCHDQILNHQFVEFAAISQVSYCLPMPKVAAIVMFAFNSFNNSGFIAGLWMMDNRDSRYVLPQSKKIVSHIMKKTFSAGF